jgi:hypothetical protein
VEVARVLVGDAGRYLRLSERLTRARRARDVPFERDVDDVAVGDLAALRVVRARARSPRAAAGTGGSARSSTAGP